MTKRALYIDGPNLYAMVKSLGKNIDYQELYNYYNADGNLMRAYYYTAVDNTSEYTAIRPLLDWMSFNNYTVVTKDAKVQTNSLGARKLKGNMDIELCVDAMLMARHTTEIYLFSGDSDFVPLVHALKMMGNRVIVVASDVTRPQMCSPLLRRVADRFVEISELSVFAKEGEEPWRDGKRSPKSMTPSGR